MAFQHRDAFIVMREHNFRSDVDTAFKVLYLQTYSFMGNGTTFAMRFKSHKEVPRFHIKNFIYVKNWTVENMDFRQLMVKYSRLRVFFYLDPPYISSGKKYRHSFTVQDMVDLKRAMDGHQGSYLLNLSFYDDGMEDIFGSPNKVIDYANPVTENGKKRWICGYWWRF
ncbi:MAG: DNA adenine methylase [Candidatus Micrarchaeaceae archaeon]